MHRALSQDNTGLSLYQQPSIDIESTNLCYLQAEKGEQRSSYKIALLSKNTTVNNA